MLGIDWRAARVTWTVFLFALALLVLYLAREAILIFVAAFLLAYMLTPLLNFVCRLTPPHISRITALECCLSLRLSHRGTTVYLDRRATRSRGDDACPAAPRVHPASTVVQGHTTALMAGTRPFAAHGGASFPARFADRKSVAAAAESARRSAGRGGQPTVRGAGSDPGVSLSERCRRDPRASLDLDSCGSPRHGR